MADLTLALARSMNADRHQAGGDSLREKGRELYESDVVFVKTRGAEFDESKHPRDERGRWTDSDFSIEHPEGRAIIRYGDKGQYEYFAGSPTKAEYRAELHAIVEDKGVTLDYLNVVEADQRRGLGTELIRRMRREFPGKRMRTTNALTEEGKALLKAFVQRGEAIARSKDAFNLARSGRIKRTHYVIAAAKETKLHALADSLSPKIEVAIRLAFALGRRAIGRSKDADKAVKAIRRSLSATLPKLLRKAYVAGGDAGAGMLRTSEAFRAAKRADFKEQRKGSVVFTFDAASDEAISWADRHAAELIDGITETSRQAINNAIAEALEEGTDPYDEILEAVGDPVRARRIAHHEPMLAVHEGQREAWRQAVDEGLLTGRERPTWIVTGDEKVCPICLGLEDKTRSIDGEYEFDGEEYSGPPAHVGCRCTEGLTA